MINTARNPFLLCGVRDSNSEQMEPIKFYDQAMKTADTFVWHAYEVIEAQFNDSARLKPKDLYKFGRTLNADDGVNTTVAEFQGTVVEEAFATGNTIDSIVSTQAGDTEDLVLEGHTLDGSGNLTFVEQTVTLNGQTPVALTTPLARAGRLYNNNGTALTGTVSVYDSSVATTAPGGVPSDATATKLTIQAGSQQSQKAATSISQNDYLLINHMDVAISRNIAANADVFIEFRSLNGGSPNVFRPITPRYGLRSNGTNSINIEFQPYLIVPKNCDVRLTVISDTANTIISGGFNGMLLEVQ